MFLFFDIDGTLLDQRRAEAAAARRFLAEFGPLLPAVESVDQFCQTWRMLRKKHLPAYLSGAISYRDYQRQRIRDLFPGGNGLSDAQADIRCDFFRECYRQAWRLFDDVRPALEQWADWPLGIISNGNSEYQQLKLRDAGILERFSLVVVSDQVGAAKPQPEIFMTACRLAGVAPEQSVYVGDHPDIDARSSRAAGMRGFWLNRNGCEAAPGVETLRSLTHLATHLQQTPNAPST